jgi:hypothetical protein
MVAKAYLYRVVGGVSHDHLARWVVPGSPKSRSTRGYISFGWTIPTLPRA